MHEGSSTDLEAPWEYINHIVIHVQFHTVMNYIGMVTEHKCCGSGYQRFYLRLTSWPAAAVLNGKVYTKALFCLKTVGEAMECLLMEQFMEEWSIQMDDPVAILNLINTCDRQNLDIALKDLSTLNLIKIFWEFEDKVRTGHLGKAGVFWIYFIEHCHLIFMLLYSMKTNNLQLFHKCNGEMAALFFTFDGHNYSR